VANSNTVSIEHYLDDRPEEGIFRVHRAIYSDPRLFELEVKYIFERTWIFLALESQLPAPHDFRTTWIGRTPVLVSRDRDGKVGAYLNVCRHKGALLCREAQGNARVHTCPYHNWAYDSGGRNINIKDAAAGQYPKAFASEDHGLIPLPRMEAYRGLIFGSLCKGVPPLQDYLGEIRHFIDLAMDQGPKGMEFIPGRSCYTFRANWKLQVDNGIDYYHLTSAHASFMRVQDRRREGAGNTQARMFDWKKRFQGNGGAFQFENGHSAIWLDQAEPEKRPIYPSIDEIRARVGETRAEWMLKSKNTVIFPTLQIADGTSLLLRTFRPLAVDRTEMRVYCLAPIGESRELRAWRLRQFEDFFNPSGMATPDDNVIYEDCQLGYGAQPLSWLQGFERGTTALKPGANAAADAMGMRPVASLAGHFDIQNEVCYHPAYREWARLIRAGLSSEKAYGRDASSS
jgi:benzoate/toluate 1,2-dioxygenase subunit alpha